MFNRQLEEIIDKHIREAKNPLIKGFLEDEENRRLYGNALIAPTEENKRLVEESFSKYYEKVRQISYFSSMIKFVGIDYNKKICKLNNRYLLILDQPLQSDTDETTSIKDMIADPKAPYFYEGEQTLKSQITNKRLFKALDVLTDRQKEVLQMKYVQKLSNIEIAAILNSTPQNVSNTLKKALKKLKNQMKMDGDIL